MKKNIDIVIKLGMAAAIAVLLSACSGRGSSNEGSSAIQYIPKCAIDKRDASSAVKVPEGTEVKALEKGTAVRIWHYSNADKLVCAITGSASIEEKK